MRFIRPQEISHTNIPKMPMKRKSYRRRPGLRRRRVIRRKRINRVRQPVHLFKRSVYVPSWLVSSTLGDVNQSLTSTLADVPAFADFTNLYDQYQFKGISFTLIPRFNVAEASTSAVPEIMSCIDYDGGYPTTIAGILQYPSLKTTRGTSLHKRYYKPGVLQATYDSAISTGYTTKKNCWIDAADTTVKHYGLGIVVPQSAADLKWDLKLTYYLAMKNVR